LPLSNSPRAWEGLLLVTDHSTGKAAMITQWEGETAMQASNSLRQEQLAKMAPLVVGAATTEVYEVVAKA
jgi:hypothetical protein